MTLTTFPVDSVVTYTLYGALPNLDYFENTATVSPPGGVTDTNLGDNSRTIGRYLQLLVLVLNEYSAP